MLFSSKFGGSFYILRLGLGALVVFASIWVLFFNNWSGWLNNASVFIHSQSRQTTPPPAGQTSLHPDAAKLLQLIANSKNTIDTAALIPLLSQVLANPPTTTTSTTTTTTTASQSNPTKNLTLCPEFPPKLVGPLAVNFEEPTFEEIAKANPLLKPGGRYRPPDCIPRNGPTAIIVPYRNRENQLRAFLHHMHPILQRQLLEYVIIIVEQAGDTKFNRAILMNIGYQESLKLLENNKTQFQCYIFHDVDLLPEDDRGLFTCSDKSIHLSGYIDIFNYKVPYGGIFGGASAIPRQHFELINGYSDVYFGWGGEDDDVHDRLLHLKLPIIRYEKDVLRYKMFRHTHESTNPGNDNRMALLRKTVERMHYDGLNSLTYKLIKRDDFPTHTRVLVEVKEEDVYKSVFGKPTIQLR